MVSPHKRAASKVPDDSKTRSVKKVQKPSALTSRQTERLQNWNYTHQLPSADEISKNGAHKGRNLVNWNRPRMVEKLLLNIIYECEIRNIELPLDHAAHRLFPGASGEALKQRIERLRKELIAEGHIVPPKPGKKRTNLNPRVRGFIRKYPGDPDNLLETREVLFTDPLDDIVHNDPTAYALVHNKTFHPANSRKKTCKPHKASSSSASDDADPNGNFDSESPDEAQDSEVETSTDVKYELSGKQIIQVNHDHVTRNIDNVNDDFKIAIEKDNESVTVGDYQAITAQDNIHDTTIYNSQNSTAPCGSSNDNIDLQFASTVDIESNAAPVHQWGADWMFLINTPQMLSQIAPNNDPSDLYTGPSNFQIGVSTTVLDLLKNIQCSATDQINRIEAAQQTRSAHTFSGLPEDDLSSIAFEVSSPPSIEPDPFLLNPPEQIDNIVEFMDFKDL